MFSHVLIAWASLSGELLNTHVCLQACKVVATVPETSHSLQKHSDVAFKGYFKGKRCYFLHICLPSVKPSVCCEDFWELLTLELQCPDDPGLGSCSGQWPYYPTSGWRLEHIPSSASQLVTMLFTVIFFPVSQSWLLKPRRWQASILNICGEASFLPPQANCSKW